jgi:hypothetical protein
VLQALVQIANDINKETGEKYEKQLEGYLKLFQSKGGSLGN